MSDLFDQWVVFVGVFGGIRLADIGHRIAAQLPSHSRSVSAGHSQLVAIRPSVHLSIPTVWWERSQPSQIAQSIHADELISGTQDIVARGYQTELARTFRDTATMTNRWFIFGCGFDSWSLTFVIVCCRIFTIPYNNIKYITYSIVTHV